jgi:hypothetical protein
MLAKPTKSSGLEHRFPEVDFLQYTTVYPSFGQTQRGDIAALMIEAVLSMRWDLRTG